MNFLTRIVPDDCGRACMQELPVNCVVATDAVTVLSSPHGQQRRKERDIEKRDLQAAVKHGRRVPAERDRWKYTHAGVPGHGRRAVDKDCAWEAVILVHCPQSPELQDRL